MFYSGTHINVSDSLQGTISVYLVPSMIGCSSTQVCPGRGVAHGMCPPPKQVLLSPKLPHFMVQTIIRFTGAVVITVAKFRSFYPMHACILCFRVFGQDILFHFTMTPWLLHKHSHFTKDWIGNDCHWWYKKSEVHPYQQAIKSQKIYSYGEPCNSEIISDLCNKLLHVLFPFTV